MTRKSERELERALEDLKSGTATSPDAPVVVWEDPETGEWFEDATREEQVDPAEYDDAKVVVMRETVVETPWSPGE